MHNPNALAAAMGLKPHQYKLIEDIVLRHPLVEEAWVFGSRALGTFKDSSDIDLALDGAGVSITTIAQIQDELEQSSLPYRVDVLIKRSITSEALMAHIRQHGIQLK
ncbi:nucleotidyltransferase family protein [Vibrio astriarenae]